MEAGERLNNHETVSGFPPAICCAWDDGEQISMRETAACSVSAVGTFHSHTTALSRLAARGELANFPHAVLLTCAAHGLASPVYKRTHYNSQDNPLLNLGKYQLSRAEGVSCITYN